MAKRDIMGTIGTFSIVPRSEMEIRQETRHKPVKPDIRESTRVL